MCPCSNAPTPSSPPRMGLDNSGSHPGTNCCWGRQREMCPLPSSTLRGLMLVCSAAGSRSQGCSMTTRSTLTWSWEKAMFREISDPTLPMTGRVLYKEKSKTFLGVGNIGRVAAIFSSTLTIIFFFILRRRFWPERPLQHLHTSTAENFYESAPVPE